MADPRDRQALSEWAFASALEVKAAQVIREGQS